MIDINTAKLTLVLLIKQNKSNKKLVNQINAIYTLLVSQAQTLTEKDDEIMRIQKIAQKAETTIIGLVNDNQKLKADSEAAAATAASAIKTLESRVVDMQKTIDDLNAQQIIDPGDETELNKLADMLKVDPVTGDPLPVA